ncbi:hypothetical protein BX666DRAFT_1940605 [Dichotomocladium elegans]|nr:hypothetical protein BX666DRAFT_1940605 [Dichotomocladium elegans]
MDLQQDHTNNESVLRTTTAGSDQIMEDASGHQSDALNQDIDTQSSKHESFYVRQEPFPRDALNEDFATLRSLDETDHNFPTQDNCAALTSDPIRSFTDDGRSDLRPETIVTDDEWNDLDSTENILDGLDDWRPTAGGDGSMLSVQDDLDDLLHVEGENPTLAISEAQSKDEIEAEEDRVESAPELHFDVSETVLPTIALQMFKDEPPKRMTLKFNEDRTGFKVLQQINRATHESAVWERRVRAEMARQGSIARVCMAFEHGQLFRIVRTWTDRSHIFGRCTRVRPEELSFLLGSSSAAEQRGGSLYTRNGGEEDIDELFSQPNRLPPYRPVEGEEQFVFLFSFAYMQPSQTAKERFLEEECVAVWPPLTTVTVGSPEQDIYVITRFMCHAIY